MTDMQTSSPLLIVQPSNLNPVINFSTHLWPVKWKCPRLYLCLAHSHLLRCWYNTCTNYITNDMIHFISSCDLISPSILTSLTLHRCIGPLAPSLVQASLPHGPSLQSLWLALHTYNRSIKPSLILIFSTLVTWLYVMSHMQWALSWHHHLWTNSLCISHKHN
jgi:hypothetical protein